MKPLRPSMTGPEGRSLASGCEGVKRTLDVRLPRRRHALDEDGHTPSHEEGSAPDEFRSATIGGDRRSKIAIKTPNAHVLRLKDAIHPDQAKTPVSRVCYIAQLILSGDAAEDQGAKQLLDATPVGRPGMPMDIALAAQFLASDAPPPVEM